MFETYHTPRALDTKLKAESACWKHDESIWQNPERDEYLVGEWSEMAVKASRLYKLPPASKTIKLRDLSFCGIKITQGTYIIVKRRPIRWLIIPAVIPPLWTCYSDVRIRTWNTHEMEPWKAIFASGEFVKYRGRTGQVSEYSSDCCIMRREAFRCLQICWVQILWSGACRIRQGWNVATNERTWEPWERKLNPLQWGPPFRDTKSWQLWMTDTYPP